MYIIMYSSSFEKTWIQFNQLPICRQWWKHNYSYNRSIWRVIKSTTLESNYCTTRGYDASL